MSFFLCVWKRRFVLVHWLWWESRGKEMRHSLSISDVHDSLIKINDTSKLCYITNQPSYFIKHKYCTHATQPLLLLSDIWSHSSRLLMNDFKSSISPVLFCDRDLSLGVLFGWRDTMSWVMMRRLREGRCVLWMEVEYRSARGDVCNESLDVITSVPRHDTSDSVQLESV